MITKEIRIAKTWRCKASKSSYSRCHDCIKPSTLSQLRDKRHSSRCPAVWIHFIPGWIFVLEASWWEKSTSEKITVISAEYISGNFITHLKSIIHMHAWHLISINCWKWCSGVAKIDFFFHLLFYYTCWPRYFTAFGRENNSYEIGKIWKKPLPAEIHLAQHLMA